MFVIKMDEGLYYAGGTKWTTEDKAKTYNTEAEARRELLERGLWAKVVERTS